MLVKVIVTLVILIAIGALGFSLLGEGIFDTVDRAAAANFAEDARDLDQMISINEALNAGRSVFVTAAADATTAPATKAEMDSFLVGEDTIDGPTSGDYTLESDEAEYFLVQSGVSDQVCIEANELFSGTPGVIAADFSDLATIDVNGDDTGVYANLEGGCSVNDATPALNVLVYTLGN